MFWFKKLELNKKYTLIIKTWKSLVTSQALFTRNICWDN